MISVSSAEGDDDDDDAGDSEAKLGDYAADVDTSSSGDPSQSSTYI